jgi:acyl carrier protein
MLDEYRTTCDRIRSLIVKTLNLEGGAADGISDDAPLFGGALGLDSVDALELVVALEKEFGIRIASGDIGREAFASVGALARFVQSRGATGESQLAGG